MLICLSATAFQVDFHFRVTFWWLHSFLYNILFCTLWWPCFIFLGKYSQLLLCLHSFVLMHFRRCFLSVLVLLRGAWYGLLLQRFFLMLLRWLPFGIKKLLTEVVVFHWFYNSVLSISVLHAGSHSISSSLCWNTCCCFYGNIKYRASGIHWRPRVSCLLYYLRILLGLV